MYSAGVGLYWCDSSHSNLTSQTHTALGYVFEIWSNAYSPEFVQPLDNFAPHRKPQHYGAISPRASPSTQRLLTYCTQPLATNTEDNHALYDHESFQGCKWSSMFSSLRPTPSLRAAESAVISSRLQRAMLLRQLSLDNCDSEANLKTAGFSMRF